MDYDQLMTAARANSRVNEKKVKSIKKKEEEKEQVNKQLTDRIKEYKHVTRPAASSGPSRQSKSAPVSKPLSSSHSSSLRQHKSGPREPLNHSSKQISSKHKKNENGLHKSAGRQTSDAAAGRQICSGTAGKQTNDVAGPQKKLRKGESASSSSMARPVGSSKDVTSSSSGGKSGAGIGSAQKGAKHKHELSAGNQTSAKVGSHKASSRQASVNRHGGKVNGHHRNPRGTAAEGPTDFTQLMKMANDNKAGKNAYRAKDAKSTPLPLTEAKSTGDSPGRPPAKKKAHVLHEGTKPTLGKSSSSGGKRLVKSESEKVEKVSQNGTGRKSQSQSTKSVNPFPPKSPVISSKTGTRQPSKAVLSRQPGTSPQSKPAPAVQSKSFYSGGGRGGLKTAGSYRPNYSSPSSSYLEQLEQSFAELKRKRAQLQEEEEEEDDDEYDDDFVVDDEEVEDEGVDISSYIKEIFRYDKSKFTNERDCDMAMESSYSQQQFEEKRSARIGHEEDAEDIKHEAQLLEKKRQKKVKLKGKKAKSKQSQLFF